MVICPPTLIPQWEREFRRFIKPGTVDLMKYEGLLESRVNFWQDVFGQSRAGHKLLLVTPNVSGQ